MKAQSRTYRTFPKPAETLVFVAGTEYEALPTFERIRCSRRKDWK